MLDPTRHILLIATIAASFLIASPALSNSAGSAWRIPAVPVQR